MELKEIEDSLENIAIQIINRIKNEVGIELYLGSRGFGCHSIGIFNNPAVSYQQDIISSKEQEGWNHPIMRVVYFDGFKDSQDNGYELQNIGSKENIWGLAKKLAKENSIPSGVWNMGQFTYEK